MYAEDRAKKNCIYNFFFEIIISVSFNFLVYLVIIGSVISLAMFSFKKTEEEKELLDIFDMVFGIFFLTEMICKLIGLGVARRAGGLRTMFPPELICSARRKKL